MTLQKVSKHELASRLAGAVRPNTIRQIAYGHRRPSWDLAFALERVTGIPAADFRAESLYDDERSRAA
jgi:DNA-binding XRE family transcriptional regulator